MGAQTEAGVQCGADVLTALASDESVDGGGLTTARIAAITGRDRALVARIVRDLLLLGLAERDPGSRRVRLSWRIYATAVGLTDRRLVSLGNPLLREVARETGLNAYVVVRHGAHATTVAEASPPSGVQVVSWVGRNWPIARSDACAVLLSDLDDETIEELVRPTLEQVSAREATAAVTALRRRVLEARRTGISLLDEQAEKEVASAAAPVFDHRRSLCAAVVVTGPARQIRSRLPALGELVHDAAVELSARLGAVAGPTDVPLRETA